MSKHTFFRLSAFSARSVRRAPLALLAAASLMLASCGTQRAAAPRSGSSRPTTSQTTSGTAKNGTAATAKPKSTVKKSPAPAPAPALAADKKYKTASIAPKTGSTQAGKASYYADKLHGNKTASGQKYDKKKMTCAHRTLPFGSVVRVTRTDNGKSVDCVVNDRGPFKEGRVVDVSGAAAKKLDLVKAGVAAVSVRVISVP